MTSIRSGFVCPGPSAHGGVLTELKLYHPAASRTFATPEILGGIDGKQQDLGLRKESLSAASDFV